MFVIFYYFQNSRIKHSSDMGYEIRGASCKKLVSSFEPRLELTESGQVFNYFISSTRLYTVLINNLSASTLSETPISHLMR